MLLKIYPEDQNVKELYKNKIEEHNNKMNDYYPDAGFDLFITETQTLQPIYEWALQNNLSQMINLKIKCAAYNSESGEPMSFYMYPRSSISKTRLRLANSVGIIDSGYRGNLMAAVDILQPSNHASITIEKESRYFQICAPNLMPIRVVLVDNLGELGDTSRGQGGFGSTGI